MIQQILVMFFLRGSSVAEIAKKLNIHQVTASSVIATYCKPNKEEKFLTVESKMNG